MNPYVKRFASGKTRSHVHFRDILETKYVFDKEKPSTQYVVDNIDLLVSSPSQRENRKRSNRRFTSPPVKSKPNTELVDVPLSDNDYVDENAGDAGNSTTNGGQQDPPWMNKFRQFKTEGSLADSRQRI